MNIHLTCTPIQHEKLSEAAHTGRSKHVAVNRKALIATLVDYVKLRTAAERTADIIEPGSSV